MAIIPNVQVPWAITASGTINLVDLIRAEEENRILRNAIQQDVPREYILKILREDADDYAATLKHNLDEYMDTGLTPNQIHEIDELYREKCKEVEDLKAKCSRYELRNRIKGFDCINILQPETPEAGAIMEAPKTEPEAAEVEATEVEEPAAGAEATPGQAEDPKPTKRRMIDVGKVLALRNAGWSIKAIAEEMGFNEGSINQVIHRHKMKQEAANEGI